MAKPFGFEPTSTPPYYFINFNYQDLDRAAAICRELNRRGIPMWYDCGFFSDVKLEKQIKPRIANCQEMILFVTKNLMTLEKPLVYKTYLIAKELQKKINVVMLDDVAPEDVNERLRDWLTEIKKLPCVSLKADADPAQAAGEMETRFSLVKKSAPAQTQSSVSSQTPSARPAHYAPVPNPAPSARPADYAHVRSQAPAAASAGSPPISTILAARPAPAASRSKNNRPGNQPSLKTLIISLCVGLAALLVLGVGIGAWLLSRNKTPEVAAYIPDNPSCYQYELTEEEDGCVITGLGDVTLTALKIPDEIDGKPVTHIGSGAFSEYSGLTEITVPASVTSIGSSAFRECASLTKVTFNEPSSLETVGDSVFSECSGLTEITLPASVTSIGSSAFRECASLTKVTFNEPSSLETVGDSVFSECSGLTEITLPASVTSVDVSAFDGCEKLADITVDKKNDSYSSKDGVLYNKNKTQLVYYPAGKDGEYTVLSSVKTIGKDYFNGCDNLTKITIPSHVKTVSVSAFTGCSHLESIEVDSRSKNYSSEDGVLYDKNKTTFLYYPEAKKGAHSIPSTVTAIGEKDFYQCNNLTEIFIPASVTSIGGYAFRECKNLKKIVVEQGSKYFSSEDGVLYNEEKTQLIVYPYAKEGTVSIPPSVTSIGNRAFFKKNLTEITIPSSVTSIGYSAFYECDRLQTITFEEPSSLKTIGEWAFGHCHFSSFTIPASVTDVGEDAFQGCGYLESIDIPASVASIGEEAFYQCGYLENVTFEEPSSLKTIGDSAFKECTSLSSITIPDSVTSVGKMAFRGCTALSAIDIPASVVHIGEYLFENCTGLKKATIHSPVTYINNGVFYGCQNMTQVNLPTTVKNIGYAAFYDCAALQRLPSLSSVENIGDNAFQDCTGLSEISIPASVTSIGKAAFAGCSRVSKITVANDNPNFADKDGVLYNKDLTELLVCSGQKAGEFEIPFSVISIADRAFDTCYLLTKITLPSSVTKIGKRVFRGCEKLEAIEVDENNPHLISRNGVLYNKSMTELISYPQGKEGSVFKLPSTVKIIRAGACRGNQNLTLVELPGSVTTIEEVAFYYCKNLKTINIPSSVTGIGWKAFTYCKSLESITIPSSVAKIGLDAFADCGSITIYGDPGSYAEQYAKDNDLTFAAIEADNVNDTAV